jgi:hypothetical protein
MYYKWHWNILQRGHGVTARSELMKRKRLGGMLLATTVLFGCSRDNAIQPAPPTIAPAPSSTSVAGDGRTSKTALKDLRFTLPAGWTATYDGVGRWKVEKHAPLDSPILLIWSLPKEQAPTDLVHFSHRLQTSSALTEGKCYLDRRSEQGNFADGYYIVGKFMLKRDRRVRDLGLAMIRSLGGHTLIFECLKIADPEQKQEILDLCKSARF